MSVSGRVDGKFDDSIFGGLTISQYDGSVSMIHKDMIKFDEWGEGLRRWNR